MCMLFLPFCIVMRITVHHVLSCYCKDFSGLSEILIKILLTYLLTLTPVNSTELHTRTLFTSFAICQQKK